MGRTAEALVNDIDRRIKRAPHGTKAEAVILSTADYGLLGELPTFQSKGAPDLEGDTLLGLPLKVDEGHRGGPIIQYAYRS